MAEMGVHKKSPYPPAGESMVELAAFAPPEVEVKEDVPLYKRRKIAIACCGTLAALIVLMGMLILILALAVFKAKQPVITINNVVLDNLGVPNFNTSDLANIHVNLTLDVDVSVYNPNHASFRYTNSTSYMYYRQLQVGEAPIPAGRIGARGTERLTTKLRLNASSSLLTEPHLFSDLAAGSFPISTTAEVSGRVNLLNVFKHHARSSSYCTMSISVASQSVQNMTCTSHVKL